MHRHLWAKSRDLLRKLAGRPGSDSALVAQALDPFGQYLARCVVKPADHFWRETLRERNRGKLRGKENLVGISVADAAEITRIGERTFKRVIVGGQHCGEFVQAG